MAKQNMVRGNGEWDMTANGSGFLLGVMKCFETRQWWWLNNSVGDKSWELVGLWINLFSNPEILLKDTWWPIMHACMGAKLLQFCLTLCNPRDCGPPGSSVHGTLQAEILEWVATPSSGDLPNLGIQPLSLVSPALAGGLFTTSATCKAHLRDHLPKSQYQWWKIPSPVWHILPLQASLDL